MEEPIKNLMIVLSFLFLQGVWVLPCFGQDSTEDIPFGIEKSQREGKPILLYFYSPSCFGCIHFAKAMETNEELQAILEKVVMIKLNCFRQSDHPFTKYCANAPFPSFKLLKKDLTPQFSWATADPETFIFSLENYLNGISPVEIHEKVYRNDPSATNAMALGDALMDEEDFVQAHEYFKTATKLEPEGRAQFKLLNSRSRLVYIGKYERQQLRQDFHAFLDSETPNVNERVFSINRLAWLSMNLDQKNIMLPYWKQLEKIDRNEVKKMYQALYDFQMKLYKNTWKSKG